MSKESKEQRKERQALEEWQMVDVLLRAGNIVDAEVRLCSERKWRADYLINGCVCLEIDGIGFGHMSRAGVLRDIDKSNQVAANGWRLCRVTRDMVADGRALDVLAACGVRVEISPSPSA